MIAKTLCAGVLVVASVLLLLMELVYVELRNRTRTAFFIAHLEGVGDASAAGLVWQREEHDRRTVFALPLLGTWGPRLHLP